MTALSEEGIQRNEERLRLAAQAAGIHIFDYDHRSNQLYVTLPHDQIAEQAQDETIPLEAFLNLVHPEDRNQLKEALQHACDANGDGSMQVEYRIVDSDGTTRWMKNRQCTLSEGEGSDRHPVRTIGAIFDVTEQKQIETTLRRSESRYRALIETQTDLISRYGPDTVLTFVNDAYCRFYGKSREELIGQSFLTMVAPEFHAAAIEETAYMMKNPAPVSGEYLNYSADGQEHWIHWIIKGVPDETGEITELQAIGHDITRLKRTEESLRASEERLRQAVRVGNVGIFDEDHVNASIYWSPEQRHIWGWDDDEMVTSPAVIRDVHPDDLGSFVQAVEQSHDPAGDGRFNMEHRIIDRSGMIRWLNVRAQTLFKGEGTERSAIRTIGATTDITARKLQEEALKHYNQRLFILRGIDRLILSARSVSEVAGIVLEQLSHLVTCEQIGIGLYNPQGIHQQTFVWHTAAGGMATIPNGRPLIPDAALDQLKSGQTVVIADLRSSEQKPTEFTNDLIERGIRSAMAAPLILQDRTIGYLALESKHIAFFTPDQQQLVEAIATQAALAFRQTELNEQIARQNSELEKRVIERTQELQDANEEIRNFVYIVSHDLRAPLVNLKGFAAELRIALKEVESGWNRVLQLVDQTTHQKMQRALQEDIPEALQFIESSVSNMDTFTKAMLKLARLGRLQLELIPVDVQSLLDNMLSGLSHQIKQQGIRITVGEMPVITADFVSMEQIFGNILSNAIAYLSPDRPGEIVISAEENEHEFIFHIRDNGRGIAKEDADKIFAPFRRAGKQNVPGEGMGLAYVQALVRRHGGRVWYDSELGVGTTFTICIPRNVMHDNPVS